MTIIEILFWFAGQLLVAGAIYGTIKTELKHLHEMIASVRADVHHAHVRLDNHIERRSVDR